MDAKPTRKFSSQGLNSAILSTFYIIITNPNHHWDNAKPIIEALFQQKKNVEVISFCELRRLKSPSIEAEKIGVKLRIPFGSIPGAKPSSGTQALGPVNSSKRLLLYNFIFKIWIKPYLSLLLKKEDKVLQFNDVAFPGYLIVPYLVKRGIKNAMLQEGIRFPLPNATPDIIYGSKGSDFIFCWGEASKSHFQQVVQPRTNLVVVGSPRYQNLRLEYESKMKYNPNVIGIFTNPIDDQGFCSLAEKFQLFEQLLLQIKEELKLRKTKVLLKTHPREQIAEYENLLKKHTVDYFVGSSAIFECIAGVSGGVVFASSVGLELLYFGKHVAQILVPNHGYVFDYVDQNAALAITSSTNGHQLLHHLLAPPKMNHDYLDKHLANRKNSTVEICNYLISNS